MSTTEKNTKNKKKATTQKNKKRTTSTKSTVAKTTSVKKPTSTKSKTVKKEVKSQNKVAPKKKPVKQQEKVFDLRKKIESTTSNNEFIRLIKIIVIITIIMALIYVATMIATQKADEVKDSETSTSETSTTTEIQYDNIMIGTMLNKGGNYYVLIEQDKDDDQRVEEYDTLVTTIKSKEDGETIYKADLTDSFNKVYLSKKENYYVDNISDFKVKGTTLVKIEDSKVVSAFDDYETIKNELNNLK